MGVNSLPKTVTRQRRGCDLNPGPSAPESSTLTTRLPSHPMYKWELSDKRRQLWRRAHVLHYIHCIQVFTSYTFKLSACNRLGCTFSDSVTLTTATLPPHLVEPPSLYVLGTRFFKLTRVSAVADGPARRAASPRIGTSPPRRHLPPTMKNAIRGRSGGELSHESLWALVHLWTSTASSDRQSTALPNVSDWHICEIPVHSLITVLIYNSGHFGPPLPFWAPGIAEAADG